MGWRNLLQGQVGVDLFVFETHTSTIRRLMLPGGSPDNRPVIVGGGISGDGNTVAFSMGCEPSPTATVPPTMAVVFDQPCMGSKATNASKMALI